MTPKHRKKASLLLRLLLILQLGGLLGHAFAASSSHESSPHSALSQALGYDVPICHHGRGDSPEPGSAGDCCAGGFCHCVADAFDAPVSAVSFVPRIAAIIGASAPPASSAPGRPSYFGATSARGPPVSV